MSAKTKKSPEKIQLKEEDCLRLENVQLKINQVEDQRRILYVKREEIVNMIESELGGAKLRAYSVNLATGEGKRIVTPIAAGNPYAADNT